MCDREDVASVVIVIIVIILILLALVGAIYASQRKSENREACQQMCGTNIVLTCEENKNELSKESILSAVCITAEGYILKTKKVD